MVPGLVIFDCDGVLVDSEPLAAEVLQLALTDLGVSMTRDEIETRFRGRSLTDIVATIEVLRKIPVPASFRGDLDVRTFAAFRKSLTAVEGVRSVLTALRAAQVPLCVASSGTHEKMQFTLGLTGLLDYFDGCLFSASDVSRGKPAPDLFLHAAARMGVPIDQAVVIEDSLPGIIGAATAGARVLAYVAPEHPDHAAHLKKLEALSVEPFFSMSDLSALLEG